jgi:hypothetical protein
MVDSGFWVPPSKISRLAQPLPVDPASGLKTSVLDVSAEPKLIVWTTAKIGDGLACGVLDHPSAV